MRVALTGAATGIGAAVAAQMAAAGHEVTAFDIVRPAGVARWIATDLGAPDSIAAAVAAAGGPFDALINNAGLPPRDGMAAQVLNVNFLGMRRFAEAMLDRLAPGGAMVTTASRAGERWQENLAQIRALMGLPGPEALAGFIAAQSIDPVRAYNLSKEAAIAWTVGLTEPLIARGLRANAVSPSAVETGILGDFIAAFGDRANTAIARAGRPGRPEEIAEVICFLAGPDSHWIKGQDIRPDGGMTAMALADASDLRLTLGPRSTP